MSKNSEIIKSGLIFHIEPFNPRCFTPFTEGGVENMFLNNLVDDGATKARMYSIENGFEYDTGSGAIKVKNNSLDPKQNNNCLLFPPISNIRTFSIWIYFDNEEQNASTRYLLSSELDGYAILGSSPPGILGNQWYDDDATSMTFIENGNVIKDLTWSNIETQRVWKNITFRIGNYSFGSSITQVEVADSYSDPSIVLQKLTMFASVMKENGLKCHFGPIMFYDRILTLDENFKNYIYYSDVLTNKSFLPVSSSPVLFGSTTIISTFVQDLIDDMKSTFSSSNSTSTIFKKNVQKKIKTLYIVLAIVLPIIVFAVIGVVAYFVVTKKG